LYILSLIFRLFSDKNPNQTFTHKHFQNFFTREKKADFNKQTKKK
jgi:hypothetical protein